MIADRRSTMPGNCLLPIQEVADACAVSPRTVRRWIAAGAIQACRLGRQLRIRESDLAAFIERNLIDNAAAENINQTKEV